jgi:diphthamide biosynthesis protein 4
MDLYAVLNLAPGASPAEIKAAYHRILLTTHPDKNNTSHSTPDIAAIKDTYCVISSPTLHAKAKADLLSGETQMGADRVLI